MKYTLIWADNGEILDNKIVCDSIQDAYAKKKKYQKSVRIMVSPAACVTAWAIEWEDKLKADGEKGVVYGGFRQCITSGVSRVEAFKMRLRLESLNCKNVRVYEYVRQIID